MNADADDFPSRVARVAMAIQSCTLTSVPRDKIHEDFQFILREHINLMNATRDLIEAITETSDINPRSRVGRAIERAERSIS